MEHNIFFNNNTNTFPQVILANEVIISAPNCHFTRTPTEYILYFITDGSMTLSENNIIYTLTEGDCLLLDPTRTHSGIRSNYPVKYFYIHFHTDLIEHHIDANDLSKLFIQKHISTDSATAGTLSSTDSLWLPKYTFFKQPFYEQLLNECKNIVHIMNNVNEHKNIVAGCSLLNLFILLEKSAQYNLKKEVSTQDRRVLELINYIKKNYNSNINSEKLSRHFYNNYDYLNRIFKKQTGKTIFTYLNEYRVMESKRLLHSGFLTNKDIAEAVGFNNEFYYSKVFKQYTGMSPREYKQEFCLRNSPPAIR